MKHFTDDTNFEKEMQKLKNILEDKGFVMESDHRYAYAMQYGTAFDDVKDWLLKNNYNGDLSTQGFFNSNSGAVYGLYDKERISYDDMLNELKNEAERQSKI